MCVALITVCDVVSVEQLCNCWRTAVDTVTTRQQTLESMLVDSGHFKQLYIDTDRWIVEMSQRRYDDIGSDLATIKQQKHIVEVCVFRAFIQ